MKRVFIISGEESGDLIANDIIKELKRVHPNVKIRGVGGESFKENGLCSLFKQEEISIMGFVEVVPKLMRMLQLLKKTKEEIYAFKPEHIITVDSPGFNWQVARFSQYARISKLEVDEVFAKEIVKKNKKYPIKIVKFVRKIYDAIKMYCDKFLQKHKVLAFVVKWIFRIGKVFGKVLSFFNHRYIGKVLKICRRMFFVFASNHFVYGIFLILFKETLAVLVIIKAMFIYFSAYKYFRYPWLVVKSIYAKIMRKKEAKKDLKHYFKIMFLTKIEAQNIMFSNIVDTVESLPNLLKFKFVIKLQNFLKRLHTKFQHQVYAKSFGCRVHHVVAPSVWIYKKHRAEKVAKLYDTLFCILPFEREYFVPYALKTVFIGYLPYFRMREVLRSEKLLNNVIFDYQRNDEHQNTSQILSHNDASPQNNLNKMDIICDRQNNDGFSTKDAKLDNINVIVGPQISTYDDECLDEKKTLNCNVNLPKIRLCRVSITLGSRASELKHHIPIIKKTINILNDKSQKNLEFCIIVLPQLKNIVLNAFKDFKNVKLIDENKKWRTIASSKFVIGKSGTNVMECAFLGVPSIVYYKTGKITAFIVNKLVYMRYATLLNISAQEYILPEFIQAETKYIYKKAMEWIDGDIATEKMKMQQELEKFTSVQSFKQIGFLKFLE